MSVKKLTKAGVLRKKDVKKFSKKEAAVIDNLSKGDVAHLIRIRNSVSPKKRKAKPVAMYV